MKQAYSLIKASDDTATIGVAVFSSKHIREVVKLQTWNSSISYASAIDTAYASGYFTLHGSTPHYEALVLARTMHMENPTPNLNRKVILLTDGTPGPFKNLGPNSIAPQRNDNFTLPFYSDLYDSASSGVRCLSATSTPLDRCTYKSNQEYYFYKLIPDAAMALRNDNITLDVIGLPFGGRFKSPAETKFWLGESNLNANLTAACTYVQPIQGNYCFKMAIEPGYEHTPVGEYRPVLTRCPCGTVTKIVDSVISMGKIIPSDYSLFCATKPLFC